MSYEWQTVNLTAANLTANVSFRGRGTIYAEGTFDSGTIGAHLLLKGTDGKYTASTGFINTAIDGTVKTADLPAGDYQLTIAGGMGSEDVTVYYNDQSDKVISS